MELNEKDQAIFDNRDEKYGPFIPMHRNLGLIWAGIIQNHFNIELPGSLPAHLVLLMLAASKINRASLEKITDDDDSFADARIYMQLAKEAKEKEKPKCESK